MKTSGLLVLIGVCVFLCLPISVITAAESVPSSEGYSEDDEGSPGNEDVISENEKQLGNDVHLVNEEENPDNEGENSQPGNDVNAVNKEGVLENEDENSRNEEKILENDEQQENEVRLVNEEKYTRNEVEVAKNEEDYSENELEIPKKNEQLPENGEEKYQGNGEKISGNEDVYSEETQDLLDDEDDDDYMRDNDIGDEDLKKDTDEAFIVSKYNTTAANESMPFVSENMKVNIDKISVKNNFYGKRKNEDFDNAAVHITTSKASHVRTTENTYPYPYNRNIYDPPDPEYESKNIIYEQEKLLEKSIDDIGYFLCFCKDGLVERQLPKKNRHLVFEALRDFPRCREAAANICGGLENCSRCQAEIKECVLEGTSKMYRCKEKRLDYFPDPQEDIAYAPFESFTADQKQNFLGRRRRAVGKMCPIPERLQNVDLNCRQFAEFMKCQQRCRFGYTFKGGLTARVSTCNYEKDKWSPYGFEDCLPFRDCALRLDVEGSVTCSKGSSYKAAYCNVTCDGIRPFLKPVKKTIVCPVDGNWKIAKLPYCVNPYSSGFLLQPDPIDLTFPVADIFDKKSKQATRPPKKPSTRTTKRSTKTLKIRG